MASMGVADRRALRLAIALAVAAFPNGGAAATVERLPGGVTVVIEEDHRGPQAAACVAVDGGIRTEPDGIPGGAHYLEHLVMRGGSAAQGPLEMRGHLSGLGQFEARTAADETLYCVELPGDELDDALRRLADGLLHLEVTPARAAAERAGLEQEWWMRRGDDARGRAVAELYARAFERHPYGRSPLGPLPSVAHEPAVLAQLYRDRYRAEQMVVAVVGAVDPRAVRARIAASFASPGASTGSFELGREEPPQEGFRETRTDLPRQLTQILIGFRVPGRAHPDRPAIDLLDAALVAGSDSRLRRVVEAAIGASAEVWSDPAPRRAPSLWVFGAAVPPEVERQTVRALLEELGRVAAEGLGAEELATAAAVVARERGPGARRLAARAAELCADAGALALGRSRGAGHLPSRADLSRVARRHLTVAGATLSIVAPPAAAGEGVGSYRTLAESLLPGPAADAIASPGADSRETLAAGARLLLAVDTGAGVVAVSVAARRAGSLPAIPAAAHLLWERAGAAVEFGRDGELQLATLVVVPGALGATMPPFLAATLTAWRSPPVPGALGDPHGGTVPEDPFELALLEVGRDLDSIQIAPAAVEVDGVGRGFDGAPELAIAVVGEFEPEAVRAAVGSALTEAGWDGHRVPGGRPAAAGRQAEEPRAGRERWIVCIQEQVVIAFGLRGERIDGAGAHDAAALEVLAGAIGTRLFQGLVYRDGVAYRVEAGHALRAGGGELTILVGVAPEEVSAARDEIERVLDALRRDGLGRAEILSAIRRLKSSIRVETGTAAGRARRLARDESRGRRAPADAAGGGRDDDEGWPTPAEVNGLLQRILAGARALVLVGPEPPPPPPRRSRADEL